MTDEVNDYRRKRRGIQEVLEATWDQLLLLATFGYLIAITVEYSQSARQFPLVFLVGGFCFLVVQFVSEVLPPAYGNRIQVLTRGIADEMDVSNPETTEPSSDSGSSIDGVTQESNGTLPATDPSESKTDSDNQLTSDGGEPLLTSRLARFTGILGLLIVFMGVSYLFGFIYAVPVFMLGNIGILGNRDWTAGVVAAVLVTIAIFLLFGQVIHVPITDGIYQIPIIGALLE